MAPIISRLSSLGGGGTGGFSFGKRKVPLAAGGGGPHIHRSGHGFHSVGLCRPPTTAAIAGAAIG